MYPEKDNSQDLFFFILFFMFDLFFSQILFMTDLGKNKTEETYFIYFLFPVFLFINIIYD